MDVGTSSTPVVAQRYATARILAEAKAAAEADLTVSHDAMSTSDDFRALIHSPIYTRVSKASRSQHLQKRTAFRQ
jgi:F-type H+-transporting ATPase subunit delta